MTKELKPSSGKKRAFQHMVLVQLGGTLSSNRTAADDNPRKLLSIAMKPVAFPPFPIERLEELAGEP